MIERLYIKNFALIEELTLDLSENFNILTGETGTGKSIVVDAVSLLLGGRGQSELIRTGADRAVVEGVFRFPSDSQVFQLLSDLGIENEEEGIILTREISVGGRNTCRINGRTLTLGLYRTIGLALVDIHGQHDHQSLLQSDKHLQILDQFGGNGQVILNREVKAQFEHWYSAKKELEELLNREKDRLQRMDFITYQLKEIEGAKFKIGELEELVRESNLLSNAEKISTNLNTAYQQIFGGERGISAYDLLSKAILSLNEVKKYDDEINKKINELEPVLYVLEEMGTDLRYYLEGLEFSPSRLEEVERRLQTLKDLCKKYGPSPEDVLEYRKKIKEELDYWERSTERAGELESLVGTKQQEYQKRAEALSQQRRKLAGILEERVMTELMELAMPNTRFAVQFKACEAGPRGVEQVEFLISPNPGEPLLPVTKIASGGELSRIMLAIKTILAGLDGIDTMIFDEIDSGIGGKAAQKVAEKLEKISEKQQVICVTHSPLIAALADHHLLLEKDVRDGRTKTVIKYLSSEERVEELARMLGGELQTSELKQHALKILKKNKN